MLTMGVRKTLRKQQIEGLAEDFLLAISEDLFGALVEQQDSLRRARRDDRVVGDVDDPLEARLGLLQLRGPLLHFSFEILMRPLQRVLGLPSRGNFVGELNVLPRELLEHVVDRSRQCGERVGAPPCRETARQIARDDRLRGAAHLLHFEQQRATYQPSDERSDHDGDRRRTGNAEPEVVDERLEARAFVSDEKVVSAG